MTNLLLVFLVILNVGLMAALWLGRPKPPPNPRQITHELVHKLGLDEQQAEQFRQLQKVHFDQTKIRLDSIRYYRNTLIEQIDNSPEQLNQLVERIGVLEGEIAGALPKHYRELEAVVSIEQKPILKRLFSERFLHPRPGRRK